MKKCPKSIELFAKYLTNELTEEETEQFEKNCRHAENEGRIYREVFILEKIFPAEKHQIESLVRNHSDAYITDLKRLGSMGWTFDSIIEYLSKFE